MAGATDYTWWRKALGGVFGPMHEGEPQAGFYKRRTSKGGPFVPVAIWFREGSDEPLALVDRKPADPMETWSWCCRYPISHEQYKAVLAGEPWPNEIKEEVADNSADASPLELIESELASLSASLDAFLVEVNGGIRTQAQCDKAATFKKRFDDVEARIEKERKAEKEPHLRAGQAVDAKWKSPASSAKVRKADVVKLMAVFMSAQRAKAQEQAALAGEGAQVQVRASGAVGKAVSLRTRKVAKVKDASAMLSYFAQPNVNVPLSLLEALGKLARAAFEGDGEILPGVEIVEEETVA